MLQTRADQCCPHTLERGSGGVVLRCDCRVTWGNSFTLSEPQLTSLELVILQESDL